VAAKTKNGFCLFSVLILGSSVKSDRTDLKGLKRDLIFNLFHPIDWITETVIQTVFSFY
jgi:hypothetical protein